MIKPLRWFLEGKALEFGRLKSRVMYAVCPDSGGDPISFHSDHTAACRAAGGMYLSYHVKKVTVYISPEA